MAANKTIYALYKGEQILAVGTIAEIAKETGLEKRSVAYLKTEAHKRKLAKRKHCNTAKVLIEIADDEDEEDQDV